MIRSQDCARFLQAQKIGLVVLTTNVSDYDILLQLIPASPEPALQHGRRPISCAGLPKRRMVRFDLRS